MKKKMVKLNTKNLTKKISAVVLTGVFASSVAFAATNNYDSFEKNDIKDELIFDESEYDDLASAFNEHIAFNEYNSFYGQDDFEKISEEDRDKLFELETKAEELEFEYGKILADNIETLENLGFDMDSKVGYEKFEEEYEKFEKQVGLFEISEKLDEIYTEIDKLYGYDGDYLNHEFDEKDYYFDVNGKELSSEDISLVQNLEKELEGYFEEYYNLSVKHKDEFEKIDSKMNKLFEKQFELGFDSDSSEFEKLDAEIEKVEKEYEVLEKKIGADKINEKIEKLEKEINDIYGFEEPKELTELEEERLDKLYDDLDKAYEKYEEDFLKLEKEYQEKIEALEKKSGITKISEEISDLIGFDYNMISYRAPDFDYTNVEFVYDDLEELSDEKFNKLEKLEDEYGFVDESEFFEIVDPEFVEFEEESGFDSLWDRFYGFWR